MMTHAIAWVFFGEKNHEREPVEYQLFDECATEACVGDGYFGDCEIFFDFTVWAFAVSIFFDAEAEKDFIAVDHLTIGDD